MSGMAVYMPPEAGTQDGQKETKENSEIQRKTAAAAALASIQAEEEKMAKQKPEK